MAIDLIALRKKHEEILKKNSGGKNTDFLENFFTVELGENIARILPHPDDSKQFYAETSIHRIPNGSGQTKNIHCPRVQGDTCPICELYFGLWKTGNKDDEKLARQIKPRPRYYLNALNRADDSVKILSIGAILFQKIIASMLDPDYGDITDLKAGHDFKIIKYMEGEWPKYDQSAPRPKPSPVAKTDEGIAAIMSGLHNIHTLIKLEDNEVLKQIAESLAIRGSWSASNKNEETPETQTVAAVTETPVEEEGDESENYLKKLRTKE